MKTEEMVEKYGTLKDEEKRLKKDLSYASDYLKSYCSDTGEDSLESDHYTVKYVIQHRESLNEAKLMNYLKANNLALDIIKTKEYIDTDALEAAIYRGEINPEDIADCKEFTEVETLRYKEKKEK